MENLKKLNEKLLGYFEAIEDIKVFNELHGNREDDGMNYSSVYGDVWAPAIDEVSKAVDRLEDDIYGIYENADLTSEFECENVLHVVNMLFNRTFEKYDSELKYYETIMNEGYGTEEMKEEAEVMFLFYNGLQASVKGAKYDYGIR